ncbi:MAG: SDR family NAD(P)-dependent oxidoreductase [Calditrichaeota bacterium]|nr:SDR family NAD(P)-dependent oxidoreductase [Calditrichota bacterium]
MFTKDTLSGKNILVTGGGSGLGLAMATHFAEHGANVAICGRTEEKLKTAAAQIGEKGGKVVYKTVDVRDYEAVGKMIAELSEEFGELNGLVNNAAANFY